MNLTWKTVELTDEIVATASRGSSFPIMVQPWYRREPRHLVARRDQNGWYVRTAKRGQCKEYLAPQVLITIIDGEPTLYQFATVREARLI